MCFIIPFCIYFREAYYCLSLSQDLTPCLKFHHHCCTCQGQYRHVDPHSIFFSVTSLIACGETRVSTEVTFWHSAEYGSDFRLNSGEIPRNSAEFRGISPEFSRNHFRSQKIPRNSVLAEFRGHPR